jgi:hypothetical protein
MSNIFRKATKQKLRFNTDVGKIMVEDLWDLHLEVLDAIARSLNRIVKESAEESFISETRVDAKVQLQFDIVKSVIETKLKDKESAEKAVIKKALKQKILDAMSRKSDEAIDGKSLEELQSDLEKLDE